MKTCGKCGQLKDDSEFSWSILGVKRHSRCKSCRAEDRLDYYAKNKEKELKYKWERQVRKREEARKYVNSYKSSHACSDCGYDDPEALTFDHVRGTKKMDVSQMVNQGYSLGAIQDEIDKTEVVCGNCHIKREKRRRSK
jgi:hypothetical protein